MKRSWSGSFVLFFLLVAFLGSCDQEGNEGGDPTKPDGLNRTPIITSALNDSNNGNISVFGGTTLTLQGERFDQSAKVLFGEKPATKVEWISSTTLRVVTPAMVGKPGKVSLQVINHIEAYDYPTSRDDLVTCVGTPLAFATPVGLGIKSPVVVKPLQLRKDVETKSLAVFSSDDSNVHILSWNTATKGFDDKVIEIAWGASSFSSLLAGDVTGDGLSDLLVSAKDGTLFIWKNEGNGTVSGPQKFTTQLTNLTLWATGTFGKPEKPNILFSMTAGSAYYVGNLFLTSNDKGEPVWTTPGTTSAGRGISNVGCMDTNGDGTPDAIVRDGWQISILEGLSNGEFQIPYSILTSSLTPDAMDLFQYASDQNPTLVLGGVNWMTNTYQASFWVRQNGTWSTNKSLDIDSPGLGLTQGDLNGDGKAELIIPQAKTIALLIVGPSTLAVTLRSIAGFESLKSVVVADINGDQAPDLIAIDNTKMGQQVVWASQKSQ